MEHIKVYLLSGSIPSVHATAMSDEEFMARSYRKATLKYYSTTIHKSCTEAHIRFIADPSYRTTKVFQFSELGESAQNKVLVDMANLNTDEDWWRATYTDSELAGVRVGSFDLDTKEIVLSISDLDDTADIMITTHGKVTATNKAALIYDKTGDKEAFIKQLRTDLLDRLALELEYLISDDAIKATIEANEYVFRSDGTLFEE